MTTVPTPCCCDDRLAAVMIETRNAERRRLLSLFAGRLNEMAGHIHRYQLSGPEAAELLACEEEKLRADAREIH